MGLNDNFTTARGQILIMIPPPTVAQAVALIKQEEKQIQRGNTSLFTHLNIASQPIHIALPNNHIIKEKE